MKYSPSHRQNLQNTPPVSNFQHQYFLQEIIWYCWFNTGHDGKKNTYLTNHDDLRLKKDLKGVLYVCRQATEYITFQHTE